MYNKEEFEDSYKKVYAAVIKEGVPQKKHCVIFLGGQPGAGKSSFYSQDNNLNNYIVIDGDKYRAYHPEYDDIVNYDFEHYAERTQGFANACVEKLIDDLSDEGYNLIIEGTLRDPNVPISTCEKLNNKGYMSDLIVMGVDAQASWQSCVNRAFMMADMDQTPREVPFDKYHEIVNKLVGNLQIIQERDCFSSIRIIDRDNQILYPNCEGYSAPETLQKILNVDEWNNKVDENREKYAETKSEIIEVQRFRRKHGR